MATALENLEDLPGSRAAREQNLAIRKRLADDNPEKIDLQREVAWAHEQVATALENQEDFPWFASGPRTGLSDPQTPRRR